jgi:hypothetical protein
MRTLSTRWGGRIEGGDLQQTQAGGSELGVPRWMPFRDRVAHIKQQSVGAGIQNKSNLIGEQRAQLVRSGGCQKGCRQVSVSLAC